MPSSSSGGLVTSFVDTMKGLTEIARTRERDRQAAIQTAVENAFTEHAQQIQEIRERRMETDSAARVQQTDERIRLVEQRQEQMKDNARWVQARDIARMEMSRLKDQHGTALSIEKSRLGLMEALTKQGYDPADPRFQQVLDGTTAEFWSATGMTAPKGALQSTTLGQNTAIGGQGFNLGALGQSPIAHERLLDMETRRKQTETNTRDLHEQRVAQTTKIEADTQLDKARTDLIDMQRDYIPKNYGLRINELQWRKIFQGKELDLREFSNITARIKEQLHANSNDLAAERDRQGLVKWAATYKEQASNVRSAAGLRVNHARAAVLSARKTVREIQKMPTADQEAHAKELIEAQATIAGTEPQLKNLDADLDAAKRQYNVANSALDEALHINTQKVSPKGTLSVPGTKLGQIPDKPPPNAKELQASVAAKQAHKRTVPADVAVTKTVGGQTYRIVTTIAKAKSLPKGTPYIYQERGKPDRYMIR